jgi:peptidoglycan/xylan/chitin deacetylase (PgdA/CDA1 family)
MPGSKTLRLIKFAGESFFARLPRRVASGSSLVLAYHNVVPCDVLGRGDASLHLPVELFREQLQLVSKEAELVSLPVLLAEHGRPGRRVAVTFDDAYTGCLRLGLPACHDSGVIPTVFVAPDLLGHFAPWDVWAHHGVWDADRRSRFLQQSRGMAAEYVTQTCDGLPDDYRIGSLSALREALRAHEFHIGNHTQGHVNLGGFSAAEAADEVHRADTFLQQHFSGHVYPYLAYPYGIAATQLIADPRHQPPPYAFLVAGGWLPPDRTASGTRIPRLNVSASASAARFRARLRGWLMG